MAGTLTQGPESQHVNHYAAKPQTIVFMRYTKLPITHAFKFVQLRAFRQ